MHLYFPPSLSSEDLIIKLYVPVGVVMRSYSLGKYTSPFVPVMVDGYVSFEIYSNQDKDVPAHLSVTLLPTTPATLSGLLVISPHTTAT